MIRKHKNYSRPRKPFDIVRIKSENELVTKYGLKNKREIWKAKAKLDIIRRRAKELLHESTEEEQKLFLEKLSKQGYKIENVVEVLALTEENVLDRRLQTILMKKGIATTSKGARQLITHKHIRIKERIVNIPSYYVNVDEEKGIKKVGKEEKVEVKVKKDTANAQSDEKIKSTEDNSSVDVNKNKVEDIEVIKAEEPKVEENAKVNKNKEEKPLEVSVNG